VEDPRILVTIIAVEPDLGGDFHLGGEVAPPAFKEIVSESLRYMGVPSNDQQQDSSALAAKISKAVPQLENMSVDSARKTASQAGFDIQVFGKGDKVLRQFPESGTEISPDERIYMITQDSGDFSTPDLSGKSLRDAMEICSLLGFRCKADGEGYVTQQAWSDSDGDGNRTLNLQLSALSDTMKVSAAKKNTEPPAKEANSAHKNTNQKVKSKEPKDPKGQTPKR
jgi:penicillin-binding protein 2B